VRQTYLKMKIKYDSKLPQESKKMVL